MIEISSKFDLNLKGVKCCYLGLAFGFNVNFPESLVNLYCFDSLRLVFGGWSGCSHPGIGFAWFCCCSYCVGQNCSICFPF